MYNTRYSGTGSYGSMSSYGSAGYSSLASGYSSINSNAIAGYSQNQITQKYSAPETPNHSMTESFLAENRPLTPIIMELGEIKEIIEKTYGIITGQEFPQDSIMIQVLDAEQFKNLHTNITGHWNPGVMGFSFNKYGKGISEIYVKQDHMDSLLLTIGHEIGHVLSPSLPNKHDEEAKAHAFSLAWMETIREHNIGGLQPNIVPNPAHNGLHDVSFDFVKHLLNTGTSSFDIFKTLAHGLTSIIAR